MDPNIKKWLGLARIDIKNQGEGNDVKVTVAEGKGCNIWKAGWFSHGGAGYVMETSDRHLVLEMECQGAGNLLLRLQGIDRRATDGTRLPLWVDYTRLAINKDIIFWEMKPQWHDKPYAYTRQVADGEKLEVDISWDFHGYRGEELARLISLLAVKS